MIFRIEKLLDSTKKRGATSRHTPFSIPLAKQLVQQIQPDGTTQKNEVRPTAMGFPSCSKQNSFFSPFLFFGV